MVVHRSGVIPAAAWIFVSPRSETFVRISPDFTDGDPTLKTVHPERRKCIFYDERRLKTSNTYSREACVLECRAEAVQSLCKCVPFYHVKQDIETDSPFENDENFNYKWSAGNQGLLINESFSSCNLTNVPCLKKYSREIESEDTVRKCQCWPECTVLAYQADTTESNFDAVEYYVGDFYEGVNTSGRASVNIFIDSQIAQVTKTDIIYTLEQLMSKLGGIFSLLLGCSFLTVMEVVYYALLRYWSILCGRCKSSA